MAFEVPGVYSYSFEAGVDLSAHKFRFVKLDAAGKIVPMAAITDRAIGILQNDPLSGQMGTVMFDGISKLSADAVLAPGNVLGSSADGQGVAITLPGATTFIYGTVVEGVTNAGEIASVLFSTKAPGRAA